MFVIGVELCEAMPWVFFLQHQLLASAWSHVYRCHLPAGHWTFKPLRLASTAWTKHDRAGTSQCSPVTTCDPGLWQSSTPHYLQYLSLNHCLSDYPYPRESKHSQTLTLVYNGCPFELSNVTYPCYSSWWLGLACVLHALYRCMHCTGGISLNNTITGKVSPKCCKTTFARRDLTILTNIYISKPSCRAAALFPSIKLDCRLPSDVTKTVQLSWGRRAIANLRSGARHWWVALLCRFKNV